MAAYRVCLGFAVVLAGGLLASCGNIQSTAPPPSEMLAHRPVVTFERGNAARLQVGNESLIATHVSGQCRQIFNAYYFEFSGTGLAQGPFPGLFAAQGDYKVSGCTNTSGNSQLAEFFVIYPLGEKLEGNVSGIVRYSCNRLGCSASGTADSYDATLYELGRKVKTIYGHAEVTTLTGGQLSETLESL